MGVCFDTQTAELVTFSETEQGIHDHIVLPLGRLLVNAEFEFEKGDYPRISLSDWGIEEGLRVGRVVAKVLTELSPPQPITKDTIRRLNILGLFPDYNYILMHFKGVTAFAAEVGTTASYDYGLYDAMSCTEVVERVVSNYASLDEENATFLGPLTHDIFKILHGMGLAPSRKYMRRRIGGVRDINKLLGFDDFLKWEEGNFIQYGIDVIRHNGISSLVRENIEILSSRSLGPSSKLVSNRFGSWGHFKKSCLDAYYDELNKQEQLYELIDEHREIEFSSGLDWFNPLNEQCAAVLKLLASHVPIERLKIPQAFDEATIINAIRQIQDHKPTLELQDIKISAVRLGIFNAIWPSEKPIELKLPILPTTPIARSR